MGQWREQLLQTQLAITALLTTVVGVTFTVVHVLKENWSTVIAVGITSVVTVGIWAWRSLGFRLRALAFLGVLACAATFLLTAGGITPHVAGLMIITAGLALLLLGLRGALMLSAFLITELVAFATAYSSGWLQPLQPTLPVTSALTWVDYGVSVAFMGGMLLTGVHFLLKSLHSALDEALDQAAAHGREARARSAALKELKSAKARLAHSQKLEVVGQIAGGVAHDLNNALTSILYLAELSEDQDTGQEIVDSVLNAAGLTQRLLSLARRDLARPRVIDLGQEVHAAARPLIKVMPEGIQVALKVPPAEVFKVRIDPIHIHQIVFNLLLNARDAMPKGGEVTLSLERQETDETAEIVLTVSDTGVGMSDETRQRVFDPFFTTKTEGEGTGLGLTNVREITEQSQGRVTLSTAAGEGTTLEVRLPESAEDVECREQESTAPGQQELVLVVEDDLQVRAIIQRLLEQNGYRVLEARSVDEGLTLLQEGSAEIDLVVTDLLMPHKSGQVLIHALQKDHPTVPILICSAHTPDPALREQIHSGQLPFLAKPFTRAQLLHAVHRALEEGTSGTVARSA